METKEAKEEAKEEEEGLKRTPKYLKEIPDSLLTKGRVEKMKAVHEEITRTSGEGKKTAAIKHYDTLVKIRTKIERDRRSGDYSMPKIIKGYNQLIGLVNTHLPMEKKIDEIPESTASTSS